VAQADVVVENFRPSSLARLGIDPEAYRQRHQRLVWCSVRGHDAAGAHADRPAYDFVIQAASGLMAATGSATSPLRTGAPVVDYATGLTALSAVLAALVQRGQTGHGAHVQVPMLHTAWALMNSVMSGHVHGQRQVQAGVNRAGSGAALSRLWATGDGRWLAIAINEAHQRQALASFAGLPTTDAADDAAIARVLAPVLARTDAHAAEAQLAAAGVPCAVVRSATESLAELGGEALWPSGGATATAALQSARLPFTINGWRGAPTPLTASVRQVLQPGSG
jgi:crotonobetainyl-CoA:carnitine CoA-transferase CaiB-like acyl-CoA transferase